MRSLFSTGVLLVICSGCRSQAGNRGEVESEVADRKVNVLQLELDHSNTLVAKYEADMQLLVRQLEVQLAQISELTTMVEEYRAKLVKSLSGRPTLVSEVQYLRERVATLEKQLADQREK